MSVHRSWVYLLVGLTLLTSTKAFGQSNSDQTATREQRQQQTTTSGTSSNENANTQNARNGNTDDENGTRNSRTGNQRQQQSDSYNQNQQNQNYSRDRMQSGNRSENRQGYDNRQGLNENRQWWTEGQPGYNQGRQFGNQSRNQQYSQQSGQESGRDEQDWNQERSGQSQINQNRWRADREYRDAYFAGLRAGQRGANEWNYASFESSDSGNEAAGQASHVRLNGKVVRTNRSSSQGGEGSHLMATVRTQRGDRYTVDLGPADEARRLELGEGDDLQVRGIRIRLGDRNLIFATDARANDESLSFRYNDANERSEERTNYEASRNRERQYDGSSSDQSSNRSSDRQQSGSQSGRSKQSETDESSSQPRNRSHADREQD